MTAERRLWNQRRGAGGKEFMLGLDCHEVAVANRAERGAAFASGHFERNVDGVDRLAWQGRAGGG